jgi:hypothetical protein
MHADSSAILSLSSFCCMRGYILLWSEACFGVSMIIACWLRCTELLRCALVGISLIKTLSEMSLDIDTAALS